MARRYHVSNAVPTQLSAGIDASVTTITVAANTGYPTSYPFTIIVDKDAADEEVMSVTNTSGTTWTVTRAYDGSTAQAHVLGASVEHGVSALDFEESNAFLNGTGVVSTTMLADSSVTSAKILDGTIATADIADGAITPIKLSAGYAAKTALYTLTGADQVVEVTSGTFTLTLPAAASWTGRVYTISNTGSGVVTLDGNAAELVGGAATLALSGRGTVRIVCTGTAWVVLDARYWDESVGRRQFAWDTVNNRWQLTANSDTGLRNVSADLINGWTGTLLVRRIGYTVWWYLEGLVASAATSDIFVSIPTGLQRPGAVRGIIADTTATPNVRRITAATDMSIVARGTGTFYGTFSYATTDAWPATLPGTASGAIPYN